MSIIERISKLIDVKSIVTLELAATFIYLAIMGEIDGDKFMTIFTTVIAFYFGTQAGKKNRRKRKMPNTNDLPTPVTTDQKFMAKAAGMDVDLPTPITPEQKYLKKIADGGGVTPSDVYTKSETDALLGGKADLVDGLIPVSQIPPVVIERLVKVADDTARFALTTATVQNGDTVQTIDNNKMYAVIDDTHLDSEQGYQVYVAGMAARAIGDQNGNTIDTTYATISYVDALVGDINTVLEEVL